MSEYLKLLRFSMLIELNTERLHWFLGVEVFEIWDDSFQFPQKNHFDAKFHFCRLFKWFEQTVKLCFRQLMQLHFQNFEITSNVAEDISQQVFKGILLSTMYLCIHLNINQSIFAESASKPSYIILRPEYPKGANVKVNARIQRQYIREIKCREI